MANDGGQTAALALTWTFVLVLSIASCLLIYFFDCCCCLQGLYEFMPEHWRDSKDVVKRRLKKLNKSKENKAQLYEPTNF